MQGALRGRIPDPGEVTDEAVAALRALAASPVPPLVLGYHAVGRTNPYQALLYARAWEHGIAPVPVLREAGIDELTALARLGFGVGLHLHWTSKVLEGCRPGPEADAAATRFIGRLDALRDAGGRLVWTIHNILPHGSPLEEQEARLQGEIVARCELVHVLAAGTRELVAPWFDVPADKVLHVPHPAYLGAYPDVVSRAQARHELGLHPDELVLLVLGAIRPYKGLGDLLDVLHEDPPAHPWRLLVAGDPTPEPGVAELVDRLVVHPGVVVHPRRIPPDEMQLFLRAADVAVLPYTRSLNSGAMMLALTFGLPVIVPAGTGLAQLVDPSFSRTFEPGDVASLARAIGETEALCTPSAREAAKAVAAAHAPGPLSDRFARELRARLGLAQASRQVTTG